MHYFLPALALLLNALIWGVSWWPFRLLQGAGLHPLWATALLYAVALVALLALRPGALRLAWQHPALWLLALAAGLTNVCFNWAVTVGDVVRVVLLFYLMPAWSVLLAWKLLGEVPTPLALLRLLLAFAGVVLVVVPPGQPLSQLTTGLSAIDGLAVAGGFFFALTNVLLRRLHHVPDAARMVAMFGGAALLAGLSAGLGWSMGLVPPPPVLASGWVVVALALAGAFITGNWALQYGAARLAASATALIMLSEVVFASASAWLLDAAVLSPRTLAGGALIVLAALLASLPARRAPT
ncbi:EamA family transporter [Simplicispira psychrophila]|uniref:EamA family transporter n=1 Tax=Simplicispira psychrophila TaxID=80882 RepID=UPI00047F6A7A|nr:EamA family transporter [Simplicispira psychrophila]